MKSVLTVRVLLMILTILPVTILGSVQQSQRIDPELAQKLIKVKRIYIEKFGDDKISLLLHSMVSTSLSQGGRFIVTENKEKADAILKGAALEKTSQEVHSIGQGTAISSASGVLSGSGSGNSSSINGAFRSLGAAIQDSSSSTETIDRAAVAVRLVANDGDLIWSTTQESKGAKFKGSASDVADKVVKQLLQDIDKIEKKLF